MSEVLAYVMKAVLCSGLFAGYYRLFLSNKRLHTFNRFYLLTAVMASLVLPALHIGIPGMTRPQQSGAYRLLEVMRGNGVEEVSAATTAPLITWQLALLLLYGAAALFMAAKLTAQIAWLYRLKHKSKRSSRHGYVLVFTRHSKAPFSFFNNLFWQEDLDIASPDGQRILAHELVHIRQQHTLDKLFVQWILVFFWFNPFYWLLLNELSLVHEFIADEAAIEDRDTESFARMLLQEYGGNSHPDIVLPFFHSSIKRRLLMLQQSDKTRLAGMRRLMALPLLGAALLLFSFSPGDSTVPRARKTITLALDAGHGGNDRGAVGPQGIPEKDLNLKIASRLAQLGAAYNIKVVTLRPEDGDVALPDRSARANAAGADMLVSIHVNATPKSVPAADCPRGFEIKVGKGNRHYAESRDLASAVAAQLNALPISTRLTDAGSLLLRTSDMPAILIECGYVEQAEDIARIMDGQQLDQFCNAILAVLVQYQNSRQQ